MTYVVGFLKSLKSYSQKQKQTISVPLTNFFSNIEFTINNVFINIRLQNSTFLTALDACMGFKNKWLSCCIEWKQSDVCLLLLPPAARRCCSSQAVFLIYCFKLLLFSLIIKHFIRINRLLLYLYNHIRGNRKNISFAFNRILLINSTVIRYFIIFYNY